MQRQVFKMAAVIAPMWPTDVVNAPADTQAELPMLSLRHGQVAWTLPRGLPPSQGLLDQLRYLQQLRVPLEREEHGMGRGYRLRHRFDHRIELGVAHFSIRRGMALRGFAKFLVANRPQHRAAYRPAWTEQRAALSMTPGSRVAALRSQSSPTRCCCASIFSFRQARDLRRSPGLGCCRADADRDRRGKDPGEAVCTPLPPTRLILEFAAWAREAPETRSGAHESTNKHGAY